MSVDYRKIGARIQRFRLERCMSQENLAEAAAVSRVYVSNLERGEKGISLETFVSILNALEISADDILGDIVTRRRPSSFAGSADVFCDCTKEEADILLAILKSTKQVIRRFRVSK